jgi:hypothetical protein
VIRIHRATDIAPLKTRLTTIELVLLPDVIKYLKGYHSDKPIPEYITREINASGIAVVVNRP